jgi:type II secretory pathway pseudopilin PulG
LTRRAAQSGITMLETMIALLIMALMAVALSATLGSSVRVFARGGALNAELAQALARRDLRLWLDHAMTTAAPDDTRPLFVGRADGFDVLVLPPDGLFWPGHATALALAPDGMLRATGRDAAGVPQERALRLAPDGWRISLRYWGRTRPDQLPDWRSDWPADAALPDLMQIRFDGPGRALPPLTLRPARAAFQSEMSLSSLLPPALPSRP